MPEILTYTEGLLRVFGVVSAELVALVILTVVLQWLLRLVLGRLEGAATAEGLKERLAKTRRILRIAITLTAILCALGLLAFNGWIVMSGLDPLDRTIELVRQIPPEAWLTISFALLKIFAAVIAARFVVQWVARLLAMAEEKASGWREIHANDDSIAAFFRGLTNVFANAVWMLLAIFATSQLALPQFFSDLLLKAVTIYLILGVGLIIVRTVAVIVDTLDGLSRRIAEDREWYSYYDALRPLVPLLRRCLEYAIWIGTATLVLAQLSPISQFAEYGPRLIQAIGIFFLARVAIEVGNLLIEGQLIGDPNMEATERRRRETVTPLIKTIFRQVAYFVALVMILGTLGIDVMPFLAGAGILGIVIGLGAQPLINDVVSGFFILFENLYLVGDFVECDKAVGTVEAIDFRTTRVRDPDGNLHIIRNGDMSHIKNFSKDYTFAVVEVRVGYDADVVRVRELLEDCGRQLREAMPSFVLEDLQVKGIVEFEDSALRFRTTTRVLPGEHFIVATRLREIVRAEFARAGIEIPYERKEVTLRES